MYFPMYFNDQKGGFFICDSSTSSHQNICVQRLRLVCRC
nr:MAG TPA: hypothetical protein [Caudoviricetes sp.]